MNDTSEHDVLTGEQQDRKLDKRPQQSSTREARVARDPEGDPIGAAVFLTAADLATLGVDPETTDAVTVAVESGRVRLRDTAVPETTEGGSDS